MWRNNPSPCSHRPHTSPPSIRPQISKRPMTVIPKQPRIKSASSGASSAEFGLKPGSSERSDDAERSILTPVADQEVLAIMNRPDSSSHSGTHSSLSRHNEPLGHVDSQGAHTESNSQGTARDDMKPTPLLEEARSYVEISIQGPPEDDVTSDEVVDARHETPTAQEAIAQDDNAKVFPRNEGEKPVIPKETEEPVHREAEKPVIHDVEEGETSATQGASTMPPTVEDSGTQEPSGDDKKWVGRQGRKHSKLGRKTLRESSLDALDLETAVSRYSVTDDQGTTKSTSVYSLPKL